MTATLKEIEAKAMRHLQIRWVGAPFFALGIVWLFVALSSIKADGWFPVMLGFASTMMGLTCFGLNHDTAIELALQVRTQEAEYVFSPPLQQELEAELNRDYANALSLSGHPILGILLPVITLCVHGTVVYLLWFAN